MRRWSLSFLLIAGCTRSDPTIRPEEAPLAPAPVTTQVVPPGFEYAKSSTSEPLALADALQLWVGQDGLRLAPKAPVLVPLASETSKGFAAEHKEKGEIDLRIVTLMRALDHPPTRVVVHVDRRVPFRALVEVLFRLGVSGVSRWAFAVRAPNASMGAIELTAPKLSAGALGAPLVKSLSFSVIVVSSGIIVKATGMTLDADCHSPGKGITFPSGAFDELRRCAESLTKLPEYVGERSSTVSANANTPVQTLVSTWDALRRRANGEPLLPEIALAVPR